jgi:hypothetical protein
LSFGFSLSFWSQTGIAEVYAPNVFMFSLSLYLLLRWAKSKENQEPGSYYWLGGFGLCFGLSLGTHISNLGFAPGFALFILLIDWRFLIRPKEFLTASITFLIGILQFAWLPIKATTLTDAPMLRNAPNTLKGIYNYTLGAFPQLKFAFPFSAFPERVVLYLYLLKEQYFLPGILIGIHGMAEFLFKKPKRFFLIISMYIVQVVFFTQYRAFDLDVFFIPSHFIFAIFLGFSVFSILLYSWSVLDNLNGIWRSVSRGVAGFLIGAILILPIILELRSNWESNDYSEDIAINDFYENVFDMLPADSTLIGRSGVFGYDMFYFRLVYNIRPDVTIPLLDNPYPDSLKLSGEDLYSTTRLDSNQSWKGPGAVPPDLVNPNSWYSPVLLGQSSQNFFGRGKELVLYKVSDNPPDLFTDSIQPDIDINHEFVTGWLLVGVDLNNDSVIAGNRLEITLYWQPTDSVIPSRSLPVISTWLGEERLEVHQIGFGNLPRIIEEIEPMRSRTIEETYQIVIPSTLEPGSYVFGISLSENFQELLSSDEKNIVHIGNFIIN